MKRCSSSLVMREIINKPGISSVDENMKGLDLTHRWGNAKWYNHFGKWFSGFFKSSEIHNI